MVKAVSDHGDEDKDDGFRSFACLAAAEFLVAFLLQYVDAPTRASTGAPPAPGTQVVHNYARVGEQIVNQGPMTLNLGARK